MTGRLERFRLWVRHKLAWNRGTITTRLIGDDVWVGFKCECGKVHGWHKAMGVPFPARKKETGDQGGC